MRHEIEATNAKLARQHPVRVCVVGYDAGDVYLELRAKVNNDPEQVIEALLPTRSALLLADALISEATR